MPIRIKKKKLFERFVNNYLNLSKSIQKNELDFVINKYDLFITGSDQVWNLDITGEDYTYFLDFLSNRNKKASYAASLGNFDILSRYDTKKLLIDFENISIREESKKDIVENYINKKITVSLDPTLLLSDNDWVKVSANVNIKQEYLLIYTVDKPIDLISYAKKIAKDKNLKIIYLSDNFERQSDIEYIRGVSPEDFLGYFKKATIILTNSFHGTVFSIIFKKVFYVELQGRNKYNDRSENLLKNLMLENRILINQKDISRSDINWDLVNRSLEKMKKDSYRYIKKLICDDNNILDNI